MKDRGMLIGKKTQYANPSSVQAGVRLCLAAAELTVSALWLPLGCNPCRGGEEWLGRLSEVDEVDELAEIVPPLVEVRIMEGAPPPSGVWVIPKVAE